MLINPERKNSLLGLELVVVFVGLLAHCFATIVNFQWFSKLPSPLNAMVARNHWDQWFFDAFGIRQPLQCIDNDGFQWLCTVGPTMEWLRATIGINGFSMVLG